MFDQTLTLVGPDLTADFRHARRQALLEDIVARLHGRSNTLLDYDDVREKLHAHGQIAHGLVEIPVNAIVGTVGRYSDFTRSFLPRNDRDRERWTRVMRITTDQAGIPPIQVYQIGSSYFVSDGNHRVSVARELGATSIAAYVTEVETKIPFDPTQSPDQLTIKGEYAAFLELTQFDRLYPHVNLNVTVPGQYNLIVNGIRAMSHLSAQSNSAAHLSDKSVRHWYETVYEPVAAIIRKKGILRDFPGRTDTDLCVWIVEHCAALEEELGWKIGSSAAATDLVREQSQLPRRVLARLRERLIDHIRPELFSTGPPLGNWREERNTADDSPLFGDILVPINGQHAGWWALAQAIGVARHGGGRLSGLYVVPNEQIGRSAATNALKAKFERRCDDAGAQGQLAVDIGSAAQLICDRARWTDLVVFKLSYPPGPHPLTRFRSGFRALVQHASRPILIVTHTPTQLHHALLAYDGSPKSKEALYMAAYLSKQWRIELTVLTVVDGKRTSEGAIASAQNYLEQHDVQAAYQGEQGAVVESILRVADRNDCDLIIIGGYRSGPFREIVLGSKVDHLVRQSYLPALVCR